MEAEKQSSVAKTWWLEHEFFPWESWSKKNNKFNQEGLWRGGDEHYEMILVNYFLIYSPLPILQTFEILVQQCKENWTHTK